ncbi:MAG: hypothetical protein HGA49_12715, partial [Eubacteriaceae bacterium]|nr:hypothetical protein [Eubacteriaceae bacterium]
MSNQISSKRFLAHFCDSNRRDKKFCFILGAGASRSSGIPTGSELAKIWFDEVREMLTETELNEWIQKESIDELNLAAHYPKIYDKRFELSMKDGYAFLEKQMESKEPSCGYAFLAWILSETVNNIVITPNFDSLTEDALFIYTQKKPLVVGHEYLAQFINPNTARPLIVKIHRDIFFSPKSSQGEIGKMADGFVDGLRSIFKYYTPVVIGYGGNDGSLMGFLGQIESIEGKIFWCYREADGMPDDNILSLVEKHSGRIVSIKSFDDLLIQIGDKLGISRLDNVVLDLAQKRAEKYKVQIEKIKNIEDRNTDTEKALSNIMERGFEKDWLYYILLAYNEKDLKKSEAIYKEAIDRLPGSPQVFGAYAIFLSNEKKDMSEAEKYYKLSLEADPKNANNLGNYANFLKNEKKDMSEAEKYYKLSLEADAKHANNLGNYANFLSNEKKDMSEAEKYYKLSLEADAKHANNLG